MTTESISQEDIMTLNMYMPNDKVSKIHEARIDGPKGRTRNIYSHN